MNSTRHLLSRIPVIFAAVFLISCLVVTPQTVYAEVNAFTPSTADTHIVKPAPDTNYNGPDPRLMLQTGDPSQTSRILVKFDLSSIPTGSTIQAAYLTMNYLYYNLKNPVGKTITVNRVTKDWVESQATWNSYKTGSPWTNPGGDFTTEGAASNTVPASYPQDITWTVTDIVKSWIQGGQPNYGFLLRDPNEDVTSILTAAWFSSREYIENLDQRPILIVEWTNTRPVAGTVMPINKLSILTPYLALAGLVALVSAVVVVKKRRD